MMSFSSVNLENLDFWHNVLPLAVSMVEKGYMQIFLGNYKKVGNIIGIVEALKTCYGVK